jgi:hypothetical protein
MSSTLSRPRSIRQQQSMSPPILIDLNGASACSSGCTDTTSAAQMVDQRNERAFERGAYAPASPHRGRVRAEAPPPFRSGRQFAREPRAATFGVEQRPQTFSLK